VPWEPGATVFGSEGDVGLFLKTLGEVCARTDWKVHAWVLMSTHYHLLLETPNANLVDGMKLSALPAGAVQTSGFS
jgi:REP element-mobilizing transposase RayT